MKPILIKSEDDQEKPQLRERLYHRRFLVPNAVTVGNLFCGFLAIIYASSGRIEKACVAIALAMLLDLLDGRVARRLNATSRFGLEFDSFSDLVSFGVAPAMLMYHWCFRPFHKADEFGVFVAFVFVVCAASRLARFNIADPDLKSFTGLPTPAAAGMVVALINFAPVVESTKIIIAACTALMFSLSFLMVSKVPFFSIKQLQVAGIRNSVRIGIAALIALLWYSPSIGFLAIATLYCLSGLASLIKQKLVKS